MGKKFTDFINKMDEEAKNNKIELDPANRILVFQEQVNAFYTQIDSWFVEEIESGKIQTGIVPINITEDRLGTYAVDEKWIQIGLARIQLQPIGTMLVGTDARIDLTYRAKDIMIIRTPENVKSPYGLLDSEMRGNKPKEDKSAVRMVWKYVKEGQRLSYVTLDKDRFEDLIIEIVDGNL